ARSVLRRLSRRQRRLHAGESLHTGRQLDRLAVRLVGVGKVVAEDDAAIGWSILDGGRAIGGGGLLSGGHVVDPDPAHALRGTCVGRDRRALRAVLRHLLPLRHGRPSDRNRQPNAQYGVQQPHRVSMLPVRRAARPVKAGPVPAHGRGLAAGRLTNSTTYRKHCIHIAPPGVRGSGIRCPCTGTCRAARRTVVAVSAPSVEAAGGSSQSPKLIPVARAVSTTSWPGSTRLGSRNASSIGMLTMCGDWRAILCPHFLSATARTAAPPKRVASSRSYPVGMPPRCKCPSTSERVSFPVTR